MLKLAGFFFIAFACSASAASQKNYEFSYIFDSPDPKSGQGFGEDLQIVGESIFVGASNWHEPGTGRGSARGAVFEYSVSTGDFIQHFLSPVSQGYSQSGADISVSDSFLLVGSSADTDLGSAHLFSRATGERIFEFKNPEPEGRLNFGAGVAVNETFSLVAAEAGGGYSPLAEGAAYLFDNTTGQLVHTLKTAEKSTAGIFGANVFLSGDYAYVAEPYSFGGQQGRVSQFSVVTGELIRTFMSSRLLQDDVRNFGSNFDVEGEFIAITDTGNGVVEIFDILTGEYVAQIQNPTNGIGFGGDIDLFGDIAVIGWSANRVPLVYNYKTGELVQFLDFPPISGGVSGNYGTSVSILENIIAVGSPGNTGLTVGDYGGDVLVFQAASVPLGASLPFSLFSCLTLVLLRKLRTY
ncbi:MAG: YncE family protein [Mangrovicoccus sp.]